MKRKEIVVEVETNFNNNDLKNLYKKNLSDEVPVKKVWIWIKPKKK